MGASLLHVGRLVLSRCATPDSCPARMPLIGPLRGEALIRVRAWSSLRMTGGWADEPELLAGSGLDVFV